VCSSRVDFVTGDNRRLPVPFFVNEALPTMAGLVMRREVPAENLLVSLLFRDLQSVLPR